MKTKAILITMFNFILGFSILSAVGVNANVSAVIAGVVAYQLANVQAITNSFFTGFITNGSEWYGKEMEDIVLRPIFSGTLPQEMGIRVMYSIKSSGKLTYFGPLSKITKAYADGFTLSATSTKKQKKFSLSEFKAEAEYSKQDYKNTVLENITNKGGIAQNDITGTTVQKAEITLFIDAVKEDVRRIFWLGDTSKLTSSGSGATQFYTSTADADYNVIDGIWTALMDDAVSYLSSPTNDQIRRIPIANGTVAQVTTHTLTGTSGTANIAINGTNYLATFNSTLTQTATDFAATHLAALAAVGITVTSSGADVILTSAIAGQAFSAAVAAANATGDLAGTVAATTANTPAQALGTDEAMATFKLMVENSTKVLKGYTGMGKPARIYATDSMIENYQDTLETLTTEQANKALVDGIERYTYRGIPIIPMNIDEHLDADFASPYPHRAILTLPDNLMLILNGQSDTAETKFWFNPDTNTNRQRTQFEFGANYNLPELVTVAY